MIEHFLYGTGGIDFHGVEIVKAFDFGGFFGELLAKGVREVVGGVGGDEEYGGTDLGELDGETAATTR
jgi:hypothetical protein